MQRKGWRPIPSNLILKAHLNPHEFVRASLPEIPPETEPETVEESIRFTLAFMAACTPPFPGGELMTPERREQIVLWHITTKLVQAPKNHPKLKVVQLDFSFSSHSQLLVRQTFKLMDGSAVKKRAEVIGSETLPNELQLELRLHLTTLRKNIVETERIFTAR